ncbi:hypothetical protein FO470_17300 [Starkeya sp. 3C]|uniref:Uncharacterized protein n=1 Tax=Ancylobacter moscoviensis TaxID=2597768 RepID=A0ABY3DMG9_9HYPH|nr:hypothetical protein [Ancylobacter moscoviensis]TSJ60507.1 hypothetical protein FO470_17300 [Ancylobacter moscoviensis]
MTEILNDNHERRLRALEIATFGADGAKPLPYNTVMELQRHALTVDQMPRNDHLTTDQANGAKYAAALRAIIERADNGSLGSSKVQDMRYIAVKALEG